MIPVGFATAGSSGAADLGGGGGWAARGSKSTIVEALLGGGGAALGFGIFGTGTPMVAGAGFEHSSRRSLALAGGATMTVLDFGRPGAAFTLDSLANACGIKRGAVTTVEPPGPSLQSF